MNDVPGTINLATKEWRRLGLLPQTRADLSAELHADLLAAEADGRPPQDITGPDVTGFARDWAYARGDVPVRAYYLRAFTGAWIGLVVGGLVAIGLVAFTGAANNILGLSGHFEFDFANGGTPLLVAYLSTGAGCYLGAIVGVYLVLRQRDDSLATGTAKHLAWTLGLGIALALGMGVGTAASLHYPNQRAFIVGEVLLVAGVLSAAVVIARRLAVGTPALLAGPGQASVLDHATPSR